MPDVQGIPAVLVQALGCMAVLMFLSAIGFGLYQYRDALSTLLKVCSLLAVPLLLWSGYYLFHRRGFRSAEVVAMLSCLTWADVLTVVQTCLYPMPLWVCGMIFLGGLLVAPCIHPWRSAIVALLVGSVTELGLLCLAGAGGQISPAAAWLGVLTILLLWLMAGCWCCLSARAAYRAYSAVAPVAFTLFLLVYYALVMFPQFLLPAAGGFSFTGAVALWVVVLMVAFPLQSRFAGLQNRAVFTPAFLCLWCCALVGVPLVVVADIPFVTAPLSLAAALAMVYYGAVYKAERVLLAGCIAFYVAVFGNVLRAGFSPIFAAAVFLLLSGATLYITLRLHARRRLLLSAVRQVRRRRQVASSPDSLNNP